MFKKIAPLLFAGFLLVAVFAPYSNAQTSGWEKEVFSAFRSYAEVPGPEIETPAVVEVPLGGAGFERPVFGVLDKTGWSFEPYYFINRKVEQEIPFSVTTSPPLGSALRMHDEDLETFAQFELPEEGIGETSITLSYSFPVTSDSLSVFLDRYVALPVSISIRTLSETGRGVTVLAETSMEKEVIMFPEITSKRWQITFTYSQPLRITEIKFNQKTPLVEEEQGIRFLAQPGHDYVIYYNPDRFISIPTGESPDLRDNDDVLLVPRPRLSQNPAYVVADVDKDGIPDTRDNCVRVSNPDQEDLNTNGRGDACDDFDKDGITNLEDNCINHPNRNQSDEDNDGIGDVCDEEESRITERYKWIPWVGIGIAGSVVVILFALTARSTPPVNKQEENKKESEKTPEKQSK